MPILSKEPDRFPADVIGLPLVDYPWTVAHVRSRQEKSLARHLSEASIPFYLPQAERRVRRSGRTLVSHLPLFGGYVFLRAADRHQRKEALRSNVIVRLLDVSDQQMLHGELAQLFALQQAGVPLIPHPYLGPGDVVRVAEGAFQGCTGVVLREKGAMRLVVSVTFLRQSVAVDFDRDLLVPLNRDASTASSTAALPA